MSNQAFNKLGEAKENRKIVKRLDIILELETTENIKLRLLSDCVRVETIELLESWAALFAAVVAQRASIEKKRIVKESEHLLQSAPSGLLIN